MAIVGMDVSTPYTIFRVESLKNFSGEAQIERIEQMVQLQNFFFFITSMVVPRGTAAPVLLKWFVSRDVPTGASSSNGTIIPIPIPLFPFLVYLHLRKFIRSMDRAKSGVLHAIGQRSVSGRSEVKAKHFGLRGMSNKMTR
ncbi:cytochrome c biogenesis CcmF C-terminal-like mitochondrial protein [Triticum aestivum]|uniref:cytochrome c biogenesis CcmF C-terminal-like mitochondrial protein n=1 Tax=Triticum aestivum TaxID=4565 RepID=UPI001D007811|nr:cytochrome c biogenesis CcmF C-terminal-like mitochondrial protein [Triticum aestivum]